MRLIVSRKVIYDFSHQDMFCFRVAQVFCGTQEV